MRNSRVVRYVAGVFYPFCLILGLYVIWHGHLTPGGGFQGGSIMATGVALMLVASRYTRKEKEQQYTISKWLETTGLLLFFAVALFGMVAGGDFFYNYLANRGGGLFGADCAQGVNGGVMNTGGTVPLMNIAVGIEVFGGICIILLTMLNAMKLNLNSPKAVLEAELKEVEAVRD